VRDYLASRILHSRVFSYLAPRTSHLDSYQVIQFADEIVTFCLQLLVEPWLGKLRERLYAGGHDHGIAAERASLIDGTVGSCTAMISFRPPKAAAGNPPPTILPTVVMSGVMP